MKILLKSIAIAGACFVVGALAVAFDTTMRVTLESKDGRRTTQWIGNIKNVKLERTLSDRPCRQGRNWGWDKNRLWVDNGCRGVFSVRRDDDRRDPGRDRDRLERKYVTLESRDGRRNSRNVPHVGAVTLHKRLSDKPCLLGRTWGFTASTIWVDRGCRAEFEYYRRR